jgi:hypothetical protein
MDQKIYNYYFVFSAILTIYIQQFKGSSCNLCYFQDSFFKITVEGRFMAQVHSLYPRHI